MIVRYVTDKVVDMVNFGPRSSVHARYQDRKLFEHNPTVTLMRTTGEELEQVGRFMVDKIKTCAKNTANVQVWIPSGGVSIIATPGAPFADEAADRRLADTLKDGLHGTSIKIVKDTRDINNEGFAVDVAEALMSLL